MVEAVGEGASGSYDEILVDEFQDTSERQVKLLMLLAGPDLEGVFAVGDAKQWLKEEEAQMVGHIWI